MRIGAEDFIGQCDHNMASGDTSQETIINRALASLSEQYGGGALILTQGTYKTDGPIVLKSNIILQGSGPKTIIEKNGNFDAITATGGAGTELTGIELRDFTVTRNAADTNSGKVLINWDYVDASQITSIVVDDSYSLGMDIDDCDDLLIKDCILIANGAIATEPSIHISTCTGVRISGCNISDGNGQGIVATASETAIVNCILDTPGNNGFDIAAGSDYSSVIGCIINNGVSNAITCSASYVVITGNTMRDCTNAGISLQVCLLCTVTGNVAVGNSVGIVLSIAVDDCTIADNICQNNTALGIIVNNANCNRNIIDDNMCSDNGDDAGIDNTNGHNFTNTGVQTIIGG